MPAVILSGELTISYFEQGRPSAPALVMLPGPTDSWRSYQPVLDRLPPSVRAVAVSQRGHGDSSKPRRGYRVEDFAADVVPLFDALDIGRAVLAGHSGSCLAVRRAAIDNPDRVAGVVLEASPLMLRGDPKLEEFVTSVVAGLEDPIDPAFARTFVADTSSDHLPAGVVDDLVAELLKVPARVWRDTFAGLLAYDDTSELHRMASQALLVWGDADPLVTRDAQDVLAATIPSAELAVQPGVGHTPRWESPDGFVAEVVAFVDRLSSEQPG